MKRIHSIDFARGVVMIIMALDHVRDLIHVNSITQSPTNLETTTPALFFTRWITYLCAPTFVFLAGTSAYLSFTTTGNVALSKRSLQKRGLYLIALEFIVVNFLLFFDLGFHTFIFEVIAAIGVGFIILALMLTWSARTIGIIGVVIIFCHNLLPLIPFQEGSVVKAILSPLFGLSVLPLFSGKVLVVAYPPIPWLGIMLTGFGFGKFFEWSEPTRKKLFLETGLSAILLFVILRFVNIYGDAVPWSAQKDFMHTFLSFMNVTKYPPSLLFCLITLGIMLIILALAEQAKGWLVNTVLVYGRVPLFYFLVHFFIIHITMLIIMFVQGFDASQLAFATGTFGRPKDVTSGVSLEVVYLIWIGVVVLLYKPCVWFGKYKAEHKQWWLKYM